MLVYGVDIQSGDPRGDKQSYAVVALDGRGDGESVERDVVSRRKLFRLVEDREPDIVATDNVYELAEDSNDLVRLLRELPDVTRLVQVTGAERPEPLGRVASRYEVPYSKEAIGEAEASARLAANNVGYEVKAFRDVTRVKVSRGRSTGGGGWSEDRYTRKIHGAVRDTARSIRDELDSVGLSYEMDVTEKYGGYANAEFLVEAGRDDLPVSGSRSGDVRVEVEPVKRDGIEFERLAERRDHVVVGVDPGTTTGVAVVDLDGEVLNVLSTRTMDTAGVVEWVIERGRPVVVAGDVAPMPSTVDKIRRSFDAAGWAPGDDLGVDFKKRITSDWEYKYSNDHERDAMAAALAAYEAHEDQFSRVRKKMPPGVDEGEVLSRVLSDSVSVESAIEEVTEEESGGEEGGTQEQRELTEEEKKINRLQNQVGRLKSHVEDLEERVEEKEERIDELEGALALERDEVTREIRKEEEVERLQDRIKSLERKLKKREGELDNVREKLDRLKKLWKVDHSDFADIAEARDYAVVKTVEEFTQTALDRAEESYGLSEDDVVLLRDASGAGRSTAERLASVEPRLILKNGGLSDVADEILFENDIPVGPAGEVELREIDDLAIARESDVERVIDEWMEDAEERRRRRNAEMVDELINEYRFQRSVGEEEQDQ